MNKNKHYTHTRNTAFPFPDLDTHCGGFPFMVLQFRATFSGRSSGAGECVWVCTCADVMMDDWFWPWVVWWGGFL